IRTGFFKKKPTSNGSESGGGRFPARFFASSGPPETQILNPQPIITHVKKKSAAQSTPARRSLSTRRSPAAAGRRLVGEGRFVSLRVLLGVFIFLAGVFLALVGFGILPSAAAHAQQKYQPQQKQYTLGNSIDPLVPAGFDCSKIQQLGI